MTSKLKCTDCGKFISFDDLENGDAIHEMIEPDSEFGGESYLTLCVKCNSENSQ